MFRAQICAVLGAGLMLAAASTEARELEFSVNGRIGGDNNIFRASRDRVADGFFELSPRVVVRQENSKLNYDFSYRPSYETYFKTSGIDGFDHRANGFARWQPTKVDDIGLTSSFASIRRVQIEDVSGASNPVPVLEESDRERIRRSSLAISYNRTINSRFSIQAGGSFDDFNFARSTSIDSRGYSGRLGTQYVLGPKTIVGVSGALRRRRSQGGLFPFTQDTETWNVSGLIQRSLTPTWNVSLQAGPSFIRTKNRRPFAAFPNPVRSQSRSTSFFAAVVIDKTWKRSDFNASYTRSESSGGDTASSSIFDIVLLTVSHDLDRRSTIRLIGGWTRIKEISAAFGGRRERTDQYRASSIFVHRVSDQLSVVGQYSLLVQDQDQSVGSGSLGAIHTGTVSLRYTFDPILF